MSARRDDNGVVLEIGALMEGCCDDCAGEPAFWHECDDGAMQLCEGCISACPYDDEVSA